MLLGANPHNFFFCFVVCLFARAHQNKHTSVVAQMSLVADSCCTSECSWLNTQAPCCLFVCLSVCLVVCLFLFFVGLGVRATSHSVPLCFREAADSPSCISMTVTFLVVDHDCGRCNPPPKIEQNIMMTTSEEELTQKNWPNIHHFSKRTPTTPHTMQSLYCNDAVRAHRHYCCCCCCCVHECVCCGCVCVRVVRLCAHNDDSLTQTLPARNPPTLKHSQTHAFYT